MYYQKLNVSQILLTQGNDPETMTSSIIYRRCTKCRNNSEHIMKMILCRSITIQKKNLDKEELEIYRFISGGFDAK